jgi:UDP-glucose 4-epimerase
VTVLVVGTEGFIGRHVVDTLRKRGVVVHRASSSDGTGIDARTGQLAEGFAVPAGTHAVIFLSQSPFYRKFPEQAHHVFAVNVHAAVDVAQRALHVGASRFIYASSGNVYQPQFAPLAETAAVRRDNCYALSKVHAEEALSLFAPYLSFCALRLFGVYGPGQTRRLIPNIVGSIVEGKSVVLEPNPYQPQDTDGMKITLTYVEDVAQLIARLALDEATRGALNVAGNEVLSIRDIANSIGKQLHKQVSFVQGDRPREGDWIADISRLTGLAAGPFTAFNEGLRLTLGTP